MFCNQFVFLCKKKFFFYQLFVLRLQDKCPPLYYDVLKQEIRFTLGPDTANQTTFQNKSCPELNFIQKTQWVHMSISPDRATIIDMFEIL